MLIETTSITLSADTKARLALLKGERTWDDFLRELAEAYPADEAIEEMERRLSELRSGKVAAVPWRDVKRKRPAKKA